MARLVGGSLAVFTGTGHADAGGHVVEPAVEVEGLLERSKHSLSKRLDVFGALRRRDEDREFIAAERVDRCCRTTDGAAPSR